MGRTPTATTDVAEGPLLVRGRRLGDGRYVLDHQLARGGMAAVWLANDVILERPVAIKVLSDTLAADEEFLTRFRREARVAAGLSHPNLVSIYDFDAGEHRPYLVMEYVAGGDLRQRLTEGDAGIELERLASELLAALKHIHGAGVLHRDVKPQNVLIGEDGRAQLTDFGIAQPRDATSITQTGSVLGTERYIAPEVLRGEPPSERSDLYALGMVLSEAAHDRVGFALWELIDSLRSDDPRDRPPSASAALAELERATPGGLPGPPTQALEPAPVPPTDEFEAVPPAGSTPGAPPPDDPGGGRSTVRELFASPDRRLVLGALGALLVAVAVAVGLAISGDESDPAEGLRVQNQGGAEEQPADGDQQQGQEPAEEQPPPETTETTEEQPPADADASGAELNDQGFALIQQGRYEEAIPILQQAVEQLAPIGDLTYAYALFNLGNALRLAGRPQEAIPILQQRLEIPNQTDVVRQELEAALAAAGQGHASGPGNGNGNAFGHEKNGGEGD